MTERRHGDPLDYPDIVGDSGLGEAYFDAVRPPHVKEAIAKRQAQLAKEREEQAAKPA